MPERIVRTYSMFLYFSFFVRWYYQPPKPPPTMPCSQPTTHFHHVNGPIDAFWHRLGLCYVFEFIFFDFVIACAPITNPKNHYQRPPHKHLPCPEPSHPGPPHWHLKRCQGARTRSDACSLADLVIHNLVTTYVNVYIASEYNQF